MFPKARTQFLLFNYHRIVPFFLLLFATFICEAQENVRFFVFSFPQNAYVELDGQKITPSDSGQMATAGSHHLKVWSPNYKVVDSTITIEKDQQNIFRIYLRLSPQYIAYQKSLVNFKLMKIGRLTPPILSLFATGVLFIITNNVAKDYYKRAEQDERDYAGTSLQATMDEAKKTFADDRKRYKNYIAASYGFAALSVIPIIWTIKVAINNSKRNRPVMADF